MFDRIGGLTAVPGGGLLVADSYNQRVRYIAPDSINLVGDAGQTEFHLPWVSALTGNVIISDNPNLRLSRQRTELGRGTLISRQPVIASLISALTVAAQCRDEQPSASVTWHGSLEPAAHRRDNTRRIGN